jgi:hypothetical protein
MQPVRRRIRADPRAVLDREVIYGEPMASRIVLSANEASETGPSSLSPERRRGRRCAHDDSPREHSIA